MRENIDVSIIIVNYNTKELIIKAVNSVFEKTNGLNYEVIIVDNCSMDGSIEALRKNFFDKINIIESSENLGFGRANNLGLDVAKGKYIFFLNPDTILINNAIKILFDFLEANYGAAICGGNLFDANHRPAHSFKMKLPPKKQSAFLSAIKTICVKILMKNRDFNHGGEPKKVGYIIGADMLVRFDILKKTGGFDPDFFMYSEECELTDRIKKLGFEVYSIPEARIIHLEGASQKKEKALRMSVYSDYLFFEKVYGIDYVKKRYKYKCRYFLFLVFFTLGFYYKRYRFLKRIHIEEFIKWNLERNTIKEKRS